MWGCSVMSKVPPTPGWWLASDGEWYPPEQRPNYLPPPPPQSGPAAHITSDVPSHPERLPQRRIPGLAIASLVLGLVPVVPFVGSILAIVFGSVARSQITESGGRLRGTVMAVWGLT